MGKYLTFILFLLLSSFLLKAQDNEALTELKTAYLNIRNENYRAAYPYYKKMLNQYPKEPIYHYYVGRCMLFMEKDPLKAISYLRYASTKDVPVDVYYYLGIAYNKNYRFQEAIESFQWFEKNASRKELRKPDYELYRSMAQNGVYLTKYIRRPLVYSKQVVDKDDFYKIYPMQDMEGSIIDQSEFFNLPDSNQIKSAMFVPKSIQQQEFIYFTKKNEKRGDSDIYRVVMLSDSSWSEPENLGDVINTSFDENYPFMHSDGTTLYFASKGHYSMGGYDIYKSTWDWNTQQWSEPENLDFPINSPYNDFLFVPTPNKKVAAFASDRDADSNSVMVYKLKLNNSEPYIELENHQEILEYANLDINTDLAKEESRKTVNKYKAETKELVKIKNNEDFLFKSVYDSVLTMAINYQMKADSLRWIIDEKRAVFDNTPNGQERAVLSNAIIELERDIYALQKDADRFYQRVREIEQANLASKKTIYEDNKKEESFPVKKEDKAKKIFYEPTIDSLSKSILTIPNEEVADEKLITWGLTVENPSIYNKKNPIPLNEDLPEGIIYMIQLGAFSSEKSPGVFHGFTPLSCIKSENSTIRKYFAGKFQQLSEAEKVLPVVKSKGFKDAYIVAFNSGDMISVKKAATLESKNGSVKRVYRTEAENDQKDLQSTDLSILFVLKGQIGKKDSSVVENLKSALPENLELYLETKENEILFLIKAFTKYDQVLPVKNKVEAILNKEVEVHAYFAENQIPLEQARKITK